MAKKECLNCGNTNKDEIRLSKTLNTCVTPAKEIEFWVCIDEKKCDKAMTERLRKQDKERDK